MKPRQATRLLFRAAEYGDLDNAKVAVDAGANVNAMKAIMDQRRPLHLAAQGGYGPIAALLIGSGADINAQDSTDRSPPLHLAAAHGRADIASALLKAGADVNAKNEFWQRPLHLAASNGHMDLAQLLIENGANLAAKDTRGMTPLECAAEFGHADIMKLLEDAARQQQGHAAQVEQRHKESGDRGRG